MDATGSPPRGAAPPAGDAPARSGAPCAGALCGASAIFDGPDGLGEGDSLGAPPGPVPGAASWRATYFTRTPSTARIAPRRSSLGPLPPASFLNAATSAWLWKTSVSTSSANATGVAAVASIHDERLTGSSCCSTSGHASRTCAIEIGPSGGVGAGAAAGSGSGSGSGDAGVAAVGAVGAVGATVGSGTAVGCGAAVATGAGAAAGATPTAAAAPNDASTRATSSSSCRRGEVAPVMSSSVPTTRSAMRESRSVPNAVA